MLSAPPLQGIQDVVVHEVVLVVPAGGGKAPPGEEGLGALGVGAVAEPEGELLFRLQQQLQGGQKRRLVSHRAEIEIRGLDEEEILSQKHPQPQFLPPAIEQREGEIRECRGMAPADGLHGLPVLQGDFPEPGLPFFDQKHAIRQLQRQAVGREAFPGGDAAALLNQNGDALKIAQAPVAQKSSQNSVRLFHGVRRGDEPIFVSGLRPVFPLGLGFPVPPVFFRIVQERPQEPGGGFGDLF